MDSLFAPWPSKLACLTFDFFYKSGLSRTTNINLVYAFESVNRTNILTKILSFLRPMLIHYKLFPSRPNVIKNFTSVIYKCL